MGFCILITFSLKFWFKMRPIQVYYLLCRLCWLLWSLWFWSSWSGGGGGAGTPGTCGPGSAISYLILSYFSCFALYFSLLYILILYFSFIIVSNLFYHLAFTLTIYTVIPDEPTCHVRQCCLTMLYYSNVKGIGVTYIIYCVHCDTQLLIFGFHFFTTLRWNIKRIMWLIWV